MITVIMVTHTVAIPVHIAVCYVLAIAALQVIAV